jgi:hypothetical protein
MISIDARAVADERARRLQGEAAAERLRLRPRTRSVLASSLRRAADRLDSGAQPAAPFGARPARPC